MGLTVVTRAASRLLTTRARVKAEPPISVTTDDAFIDALIEMASVAVESYCNRGKAPFARQAYTESLGAYGDIHLMLKGTPIVAVSSVLQDGAALTDWSIEDADAGILYRQSQYFWTAQLNPGLQGRQSWPSFGSPIPGAEEPRFSVSYVSGYLVPSQDLSGKTTISVDATDDSFNDTGAAFPALLKSGDVITTSGFANAANNGTFTVTGTPTTAKIAVTASLTTELAGATVAFVFRTLPFDLEKAVIETVKAWYYNRSQNQSIIEKAMMQARVRYADSAGFDIALPPLAAALLREYRRVA